MIEKSEENEEKMILGAENAEKSVFSTLEEEEKTEEKTDFEQHLESQGFNFSPGAESEEEDKEELEDDLEGEPTSDFNVDDFDDIDFEDELEEEDEIDFGENIDEGEDPLDKIKDDESAEASSTTVGELQEPISSPKNMENVEKLAHILLNGADVLKAKLCSRVSGEHVAEYLADEDLKATLIAAIKEYLATQEIKAPTPFGTLMMALGMWALPPLGLAVWDKYQLSSKKGKTEEKKETSTDLNPSAAEGENVEEQEEVAGEAQSDYSALKEYQEGRKIFSLNKTKGTYNRTPKGTFIKTEHANEQPSPIVMKWIDEGLSNKEIRERLGYGK
ncbi:hypothetical protein [Aureispira anguillae]|uniref:Uncharacterized protein n=1 Tax=Aureispira anguillae TaxID=2864201 RepID=A0A915YHD1_9BACT|nr:hypothetical protein [Aureispira anguillae]BDS13006.1 hypothetical protein AsAng_0037340 [Aureispira anguillae]